MKRREKLFIISIFLFLPVVMAFGQKITKGIVIDSATLKVMQGVYVRVKNTDRVTMSTSDGKFKMTTRVADTLVFTMIGYNTLELPLLFEEEDIMIKLGERVQFLKEVTITGNRLFESEIFRTERRKPAKLSTADAFSSPWEYFSRGQKERRKVTKLINENDRIKTYIMVINDQETREDIMYDHNLTEGEYYSALARFNQQSQDVLYSTDPMEILDSLRSFFASLYPQPR